VTGTASERAQATRARWGSSDLRLGDDRELGRGQGAVAVRVEERKEARRKICRGRHHAARLDLTVTAATAAAHHALAFGRQARR